MNCIKQVREQINSTICPTYRRFYSQYLLDFSCCLSSCWIIYEKPFLKIQLFLFLRISFACFPLTLLFSLFQSIKNTINRIFLPSFFIPLQYLQPYLLSTVLILDNNSPTNHNLSLHLQVSCNYPQI